MRNILLALLLANILFAMYQGFHDPGPDRGVIEVEPDELGPPLEIAGQAAVDAAESAAAIRSTDAPATIELAASTGRSCASIGPFKGGAEAGQVLDRLIGRGMAGEIRSANGQIFIGHWVQIREIGSRDAGNQMIETLKGGGLGDAYLVEADGEAPKISLGLFGDMARAERIELQAKSLGLPAEITPRTRDAMVFFVDVALPPGRGASLMVEDYGEEMVLLRGQATCPQTL